MTYQQVAKRLRSFKTDLHPRDTRVAV
jgi:hypothetical protein